jgi:hypothetical protein
MSDTIVVEIEAPVTVEVAGPQGPQGAAGQGIAAGGTTGQVLKKKSGTDYDTEWGAAASGSGTVTSIALAGTGLSITGSPVTTSGTITANVAYGTTAGTSTEGNDGRIAGIGTGTGSLPLGASGTRTTLNGSASGSDKTVTIQNKSGVVIVADAVDFTNNVPHTITLGDSSLETSGQIILNSFDPAASPIRLVGGNEELYIIAHGSNTSLSFIPPKTNDCNVTVTADAATENRTITLPNASGTVALTQQATDIEITDPTKGYILNSATKRWRLTIDDNGVLLRTALTLLFLISFMCGSQAQVRDLVYGTNNVVVGPTNTNALAFTNSVAFSNPISFGTNAATTRTNLGVTVASNLPAPWSGSASSNSLLAADGSGSSAFVSTLPSLTIGVGTNTDVTLQRETNNSLSQRNGTNPQTLFLFNNYFNSTIYERGKIAWTNNVMTIGTERGTVGGAARALEFQADGITGLRLLTNGMLSMAYTDGSSSYMDFGDARFRVGVRGGIGFLATDGTSRSIQIHCNGIASSPSTTGFNIGSSGTISYGALFQFSGANTNFPALKRTSTVLQVRLADDSAYTTLDAQHRLQGTAPTNSTDTGTAGDIRYDTNNYIYICVSSNTWRRTSLTNW